MNKRLIAIMLSLCLIFVISISAAVWFTDVESEPLTVCVTWKALNEETQVVWEGQIVSSNQALGVSGVGGNYRNYTVPSPQGETTEILWDPEEAEFYVVEGNKLKITLQKKVVEGELSVAVWRESEGEILAYGTTDLPYGEINLTVK